jgi:hypothetical protein
MFINDFFNDREPNAGALIFFFRIEPLKYSKDFVQVNFIETNAIIIYRYPAIFTIFRNWGISRF